MFLFIYNVTLSSAAGLLNNLAEQNVRNLEGYTIRCPIVRDTWLSSVGKERFGGNGGAGKLKLKGQQEYILLDIDPAFLKGKIITGALLHIRSASPRKAPLMRIGVSTVASRWTEGSSTRYNAQVGSSCFNQAAYKERDWAYPGSTLMDVVFGFGHTIWKFADCTQPDRQGWQALAVDPDVVAARVTGLSHGFCLYDEVGSTWSYKNGQFQYHYFPNRFCYSRKSLISAPWLEVWVNGTDSVPPDTVKNIRFSAEKLPPGEALVFWATPEDKGGGKTLGFYVYYEKDGQKRPIPRYLIPMAGDAGDEILMHLQDLPFGPGEEIRLGIEAVDSAGNVGDAFSQKIRLSDTPLQINMPEADITPFPPSETLPQVGGITVSVVDLLDKTDPRSGRMIPPHDAAYKRGNHLFSAKEKRVRLYAARNEAICFQIGLEGRASEIRVEYLFERHPLLKPSIYQFAYVNVNGEALPDPLIPLDGFCAIPSESGKIKISEQTRHSLICELYVPHEALPGKKYGKLRVAVGDEQLEVDIDLTVWNFTLPDKLSFIPEMNAYGTVSPYRGYDYYRLAHEHRTCLNRLPYGWNGQPAFAPLWDGSGFDWKEWDRNVGPLLDGAAFSDLPRGGEAVDVFYLPFNENWPVNLFEHYQPSYWADEAFAPAYSDELKKSFAAFAKHCAEKRWYETIFQFYLNNKVYYRRHYSKSSAPWVFDEPVNIQDFWALRWYGLLWRSAVDPIAGKAKMWYRGDISHLQFGRNILWGIMDVTYLGTNNAQKTRMKKDEQMLYGTSYFAEYGTANPIDTPNIQPVLWCLSAWSKGAMAVLPWQSIGSRNCWGKGEQTALFYPRSQGPCASVRLKAFRRGQQDVEYLSLLCNTLRKEHIAVANRLKESVNLKENVQKYSENDAGTLLFDEVDITRLWKFRYAIGKMLSESGLQYKRALVKQENPNEDIKKILPIGYVSVAPTIQSDKPFCISFEP